MNSFVREELVKKLSENTDWDVLIIGGGATGLGVAVDAATRGYKTLLAEQVDFAKGTSSRSTKLVHGGVRYLAQGNIRLVKEALRERGLLLKNAPHLTKNESFIIPCYSWFRGVFYAIGLKMYDWLSGRLSLGKSKWIGRKEVIRRIPAINSEGLKCGILYHDGAFDDARLAVNLAQTAVENGATVLNYCKVTALQKREGKICGATITDKETGNTYGVNTRTIINATGVFADEILLMDAPEEKPIIRPSQGVHLVLDQSFLQSDDAIMIPHTTDGRVLFAIPWHGSTLIGTTDTPLTSHSLEPRALSQEVYFILKNAGNYLRKKPSESDIRSVFAGLRPLAATGDGSEKTKEISRSHKVMVSRSGLISIIGGKWTTYRRMAEDTIDKAISLGNLPGKKCVTSDFNIHGYTEIRQDDGMGFYGSDEENVRALTAENPEWGKALSSNAPIIGAQVVWAIRNEMARTIEDVLARRTRILFIDAEMAITLAPAVGDLMMKEMGKDQAWKEGQILSFIKLAKGYQV